MSLYVCRVNSFKWNSEPRILTATVGGQFSLNGVQVGSSGLLDSTFHSLAGLGIQRTVCEQSEFWCQWRMSSHHRDLPAQGKRKLGSQVTEVPAPPLPLPSPTPSFFSAPRLLAHHHAAQGASWSSTRPRSYLDRPVSSTPSDPGMAGPAPF